MTPAFELRNAELHGPRLDLGPIDWEIAARGVSLLLGPSGGGKSSLLRGLAGRLDPDTWRTSGYWARHGEVAADGEANESDSIAFIPQARAVPADGGRALLDRLRNLPSATTLLLDEPERQVDASERNELVKILRARARGAAVVVVTHNLDFARAVGDFACLIAAGRIVAQQEVAAFFEEPASETVAEFVRTGNCWPEPRYEPPLPNHFHWVIPNKLAGMARPGLFGSEDEELEAIARAGVEILVSSTIEPFPRKRLQAFGIEGRHLPIRDMGVPPLRLVSSLCAGLDRAFEAERGVAIHCRAGLGRTGTLLAAMLVWRGDGGDAAIEKVRAVEPKYIQTPGQENFVREFAEVMGR